MRIADGAVASAGDLIICTRNDHSVEAGEPGRTLANGDLLRIDAVTPGGLIVRRALDADPRTGQRRWTGQQFLYAGYSDAELGYAVTDHVAQSRTVTAGLAVITGTEDRQHAYVALSRGTDTNMAYVFTRVPEARRPGAGPAPGPGTGPLRPDHRRTRSEPADRGGRDQGRARRAGRRAGPRWPAAVRVPDLAAGPGQRRSPGRPERDLDRPDHPGPRAALPGPAPGPACRRSTGESPATRPGGCGGPCAPPSWPAWTPARSWPPRSASGTWPAPATWPPSSTPGSGTGSAPSSRPRRARGRPRSPPSPTPNAAPTLTEIAALMDARKDRIGEHAAEHAPPWAVAALGPVPDDPLDRLDWQQRAASIGAWRELSGHGDPADPIGPEPVAAAPDLRAAWHEALAALGPADGPDVRGMPDGRLLHLRDTYPIETAWAPQ